MGQAENTIERHLRSTESSTRTSSAETTERLRDDSHPSDNTSSVTSGSQTTELSNSVRAALPNLTISEQKDLQTGLELVRKDFKTVDQDNNQWITNDELVTYSKNNKLSDAQRRGVDALRDNLDTVAAQNKDWWSDNGKLSLLKTAEASKADLNLSLGLPADAPFPADKGGELKPKTQPKVEAPTNTESPTRDDAKGTPPKVEAPKPKTAEEKLADAKTSMEEKLKILEDFDKKGIHKITLKDADGKQRDYEIEVENFGKGKKGIYLFTNDDSGHNQTVLRANKIGDKYSAQQDEQGKDVSMTVWQPPKKAHSRK